MTKIGNKSIIYASRAVLLGGVLLCAPAFADGSSFTKQDAAKQAQKENGGGRVLGVTELTKNGDTVFEVKLITNGKVRVLTIKAP